MTNAKKGLGTELPEPVLDQWNEFVEKKGCVKWRAFAAAMLLFQLMPAGVRDRLMEMVADQATTTDLAKRLAEALDALLPHDAPLESERQPQRRRSATG